MEPAPEWTAEVEQSLADVIDAVRAAGRNAAAQPLWQFLQRGGRLPAGRLLRGALAGPQVYEVLRNDDESPIVRRAADFSGAPPQLSASAVGHHVAAVTTLGEVLCSEHPREGLFPVPLPWPAAAVSCGREVLEDDGAHRCYAVARQRGGSAVCRWRLGTDPCGSGITPAPEIVRGLPSGDPVVALESGEGITVALTASGAAFGWGDDALFGKLGASSGAVVRIPQLSGRRIRRLACGLLSAAAETEDGEVLCLVHDLRSLSLISTWLSADAPVAFPLRDMFALSDCAFLLDALGRMCVMDMHPERERVPTCQLMQFPQSAEGQRAVRICIACDDHADEDRSVLVVLTDRGELWNACRAGMQSISAAHPELPLGLLPQGGMVAGRVVLLPDLSCGKNRVILFVRIAVRLRLPTDPLRVQLLRYAVQSCYVVGPEDSPFSWPEAPAATLAAVAGS